MPAEAIKHLYREDTISAGRGLRSRLRQQADMLKRVALALTCAPEKVVDVVAALRQDLSRTREQLETTQDQLARRIARELVAKNQAACLPYIIATVPDISAEVLRNVARALTENKDLVVFLAAPQEENTHVLVARGTHARIDCGRFLKRAAYLNGSPGGGRPNLAEARLPKSLDWPGTVTRVIIEL